MELSNGYPARGSAELYSDIWPIYMQHSAQSPTAYTAMQAFGPLPNNLHSEPLHYAHKHITWASSGTNNQKIPAYTHSIKPAPQQHYELYKHNRSSHSNSGATTATTETYHHHQLTDLSHQKSASSNAHSTSADQPHQDATAHRHLWDVNTNTDHNNLYQIQTETLHNGRNVEQPSSSNRAHSATRNKIGHKAAPPQPPAHYIPRTESLTQRHFHGIDPFEEDSDGLEFPSAHLQISRPVPKAQPPQPTDYQLLPQLRTLVNIQNYQPRAITGEDSSYFIGEIPAPYMRHPYPSAPGELSPTNNRRTTWQLPSDILHQLNSANIQHPTNITHRSMTPWGLFTRMQMHTPTGQFTHTEQALTIPFATQTANPELAIIQWLFHQRITHDRQAATQDFLTELQRDQDIVPASYFNSVARDWITTAADLYRITINRQMTPASATMRNMAQTILTTINDNTTPQDRHMVSDSNIGLNSIGELYFI